MLLQGCSLQKKMSNNSFLAQEVRDGARTSLLTSPSSPPRCREPGPPLETLQVLGQVEARAPSCARGGLLPRSWGAGAVGSSTPGAQPRTGQHTATPQGGKRAALLILGPWACVWGVCSQGLGPQPPFGDLLCCSPPPLPLASKEEAGPLTPHVYPGDHERGQPSPSAFPWKHLTGPALQTLPLPFRVPAAAEPRCRPSERGRSLESARSRGPSPSAQQPVQGAAPPGLRLL